MADTPDAQQTQRLAELEALAAEQIADGARDQAPPSGRRSVPRRPRAAAIEAPPAPAGKPGAALPTAEEKAPEEKAEWSAYDWKHIKSLAQKWQLVHELPAAALGPEMQWSDAEALLWGECMYREIKARGWMKYLKKLNTAELLGLTIAIEYKHLRLYEERKKRDRQQSQQGQVQAQPAPRPPVVRVGGEPVRQQQPQQQAMGPIMPAGGTGGGIETSPLQAPGAVAVPLNRLNGAASGGGIESGPVAAPFGQQVSLADLMAQPPPQGQNSQYSMEGPVPPPSGPGSDGAW